MCACGLWHIAPVGWLPPEERERQAMLAKIKKLEESVKFWNNAWHEMRERVGKCYWEIPYAMRDRKLSDSDLERLKKLKEFSDEC
jgi:hypothetical protein